MRYLWQVINQGAPLDWVAERSASHERPHVLSDAARDASQILLPVPPNTLCTTQTSTDCCLNLLDFAEGP